MTHWRGKQVVILGAARQGTALARYLTHRGARVTLTDARAADQLQAARDELAGLPIRWACGGHPLEILDGCDLICPSGGVPLELPILAEARRREIAFSNDSQIFLEAAPCKVIGITGSAGKTTTTTLVGRMAQAAASQRKTQSFMGGNIGNPLLEDVDRMTADDLAVMELSSFQLEIMTRAPQVAAITNITPNHLDRHGTMEVYTAAKANILKYQRSEDAAVLNRDDPGSWNLAGLAPGRVLTFGLARPPQGVCGSWADGAALRWQDASGEQILFPRQVIQLRGEHNLYNVLAACAIGLAAGLPVDALSAGVEGFGGVAHRLEFVRRLRGADWYNGSIASAPERVMADMRAFSEPLVILVGGRDKHLPWDKFAEAARERVRGMILFGEMAGMVEQELHAAGSVPYLLKVVPTLKEAVLTAADMSQPGDVVLLSPGGTSFDEFRDFEERGAMFRQWVQNLS